ncbi:RNA-binding protein with serine-rich domain 1-like [Rhopalosiphum maidis]|uniref:RNA-binding protein with serine-rich domain 1-like n=1 Tax=Rhopalosiphum maidis TaxID=43146 RepID=UPI000F001287|nr:RNA-binding protein with serine-rich domain 1-like [Rhopalosiphum maidis]
MASSNYNSNSKNSIYNTFLNLSRSRNSSNIKLVKEKLRQMKKIRNKIKKIKKYSPKNLKWYNVTVKYSDSLNKTLKKPRSSIPIECKIECPKTSCCIRITNLSRRVTTNNLHEIFSEFGEIKKLDLHFNNYDRISKGFSYIMFSGPEESENAVESMNRCEIDGYEIICELWFLPFIEYHVSSILRGACSGVRYKRSSSRRVLPIYIKHHSPQVDRLKSYSRSPLNSLKSNNYLSSNRFCSGSSNRSYSRSPRQSRLRSRSNSQSIQGSICSKHSRSRS